MVEVAIMIEGQDGLDWGRWQRLARSVEDLGFDGLHRSDHFTNPNPPDQDSLDLWPSLTWLADRTKRITFGPLVSPISFRHPVHTARMAAAVDDLSGGRLILGLGAGWQEREHHSYGFDLLDVPDRFQRFEEGLEVITRLLQSDRPSSFEGEYYELHGALLLPRPRRPGGPPILIGGNGPRYTLPLAARFADEWNAVFLPAERFSELNGHLDELLEARGREPRSVSRSLMTNVIFGRDDAEIKRILHSRSIETQEIVELQRQGYVAGTGDQIAEQLGRLSEAGVQRIMLQWLELDELDRLEAMAVQVLPQVRN